MYDYGYDYKNNTVKPEYERNTVNRLILHRALLFRLMYNKIKKKIIILIEFTYID